MCCRQSALSGHAGHFRQSILLSSFESPEINALAASWRNHSGLASITARHKGTIAKVIPQVRLKQPLPECHHVTQALHCTR